MIVSDIFKLLDKFSYCSIKDIFSVPTNQFKLIKLLDVNWDKFENLENDFQGCVLENGINTYFICKYKEKPFLLVNYIRKEDLYICHCTDVEIYEDLFMHKLLKYAVRWNKCSFSSNEDNLVDQIPI